MQQGGQRIVWTLELAPKVFVCAFVVIVLFKFVVLVAYVDVISLESVEVVLVLPRDVSVVCAVVSGCVVLLGILLCVSYVFSIKHP